MFVSQPSVSMETETTQRMLSPRLACRPCSDLAPQLRVGDFSDRAARAASRCANSRLNCSISGPASSRNWWIDASSASDLLAVDQQGVRLRQAVSYCRNCGNRSRWPLWTVWYSSSSFLRWKPEIHQTSFGTAVFAHTTIKTGGTVMIGCHFSYVCLPMRIERE